MVFVIVVVILFIFQDWYRPLQCVFKFMNQYDHLQVVKVFYSFTRLLSRYCIDCDVETIFNAMNVFVAIHISNGNHRKMITIEEVFAIHHSYLIILPLKR